MIQLVNASKEAAAKQLGEVAKAAGLLRKCLMVEIDGIGRYDPLAVNSDAGSLRAALEELETITGEEIAPGGLFREDAA
jgi:hypothetical protein